MTPPSEAVILMAGEGSRLRGANRSFLKPFTPVNGRPLISYVLDTLTCAGIKTLKFVVGYESERTIAQVKQLVRSNLRVSFIENRAWQKQNGISLLEAADHVAGPFVLTMSDHLFDDTIIDHLLDSYDPDFLNVAIDRKLGSIFDLADAMKVRIRGERVTAIGKDLADYDAIDIGLFICPLEIFEYLERAKSRNGANDCSLADGVRVMAGDNKVRAVDIGDGWWQDVDTVPMLQQAEVKMTEQRQLRE
jgi:1L-myo-inositol 1-phosphate cytidylyltransferase